MDVVGRLMQRSSFAGGFAGEESAVVAPNQGATPMDNGSKGADAGGATGPAVREQDRFMPIANVIRIMRRVLPAHAKIADDAKEMIQECVSEYISFITSEANERCQREQRKTVTAEDVLWAMNKLGFDDYVEPLTLFLHRYRELEGDHRGSIRGDAIQIIKHRAAGAATPTAIPDMNAGSQFFAAAAPLPPPPPPPPSFIMPPPITASSQQINLMSDSVASYFLNMYGSGEGPSAGGGSYSGQVPSGMPHFDHHPFPPYK